MDLGKPLLSDYSAQDKGAQWMAFLSVEHYFNSKLNH